jgi:hypothetical protein
MTTPLRLPSNIVICANAHIQYLCERMRPDEIEQWEALNGCQFDADAAARGLMNLGGVKFTVMGSDGLPVAAGGFYEDIPDVWGGWMIGSMEGWATDWRSMTKGARWLVHRLVKEGARRLFIKSLVTRTRAITWYERALGFTHEGTAYRYCFGGKDLGCYSLIPGGRE